MLELPKSGDIMRSENARHLNGARMMPQDAMMCDSCGDPVLVDNLKPEFAEELL